MNNMVISGNQNTTLLMNQLKQSAEQYPNLNKKEEQKLIKKYKKNREELNRLLFMHNIKLVFNMAKKYMSKTNDFDGLVQDGMLGLSEAVSRFDINKNIKFCTYAYIWIKKYMTMNFYGKQIELDKRSTSLNNPNLAANSKSNNGNETTFEDFVNDYIDPTFQNIKSVQSEISAIEQSGICKNLIEQLNHDTSLSSDQKNMFVEMFYNHGKPKELAEKYNMTVKEIANVKNIVLNKFKNILANDYRITDYSQVAAC